MARIKSWFSNLFGAKDQEQLTLEAIFAPYEVEYAVRDFALQTAIGLIARTLAKCEVKTYLDGKAVKKQDYYRFNVAPNSYQSANAFMQKLISHLFIKNEALVISHGDNLLVADSFEVTELALLDWQFKGVIVNDFQFEKTFYSPDVMYFRLNNKNVTTLLESVYESYAKMLSAAKDTLSSGGAIKLAILGTGQFAGNEADRAMANELMTKRISDLWKNRNAAVLVPGGYSIQDLTKGSQWGSTRDYRAMVDDIFDYTGIMLGIPPVLLRGDTAGVKEAHDVFLTHCIDPAADVIETEINRQLFTPKQYMAGNYVKIDTSRIKHFELFDVPSAVEKLIGSGSMTINELRETLGLIKSNDPIADEHLITKNFGTAEEVKGNATKTAD